MNYTYLSFIASSLHSFNRLNLPFIDGLKLLAVNLRKNKYGPAFESIAKDISSGKSIEVSFLKYSDLFPEFFVKTLAFGFSTDCLEKNLVFLKNHYSKNCMLKNKILSAILYTICILILALFVISILFYFVIPVFMNMFAEMRIELPMSTRLLFWITNFLSKFLFLSMLLFFIAIPLLIYCIKKNFTVRIFIHRFLLRLPVIGKLILKSNIISFCNLLHYQIETGMPLIESLENIYKSVSNEAIKQEIKIVISKIKAGSSFSHAIERASFFSLSEKAVIRISEKGECLTETLAALARENENFITESTILLAEIIEPIMIVFGGALVSLILSALFHPMFSLVDIIN